MQWFINSLFSNLIVIVLVALGNNLCFVAVAKIRKWRLERKDTIKKLEAEIENLEAINEKLHDRIADLTDQEVPESADKQPALILKHFGNEALNVVNG